ncbi:MAG: O-methyltransferase-domain-containing protein [Linnemannia gamsii]|nr:MAG: O-methyltransferase-domain-containing protein [Linnemannia gamsii]
MLSRQNQLIRSLRAVNSTRIAWRAPTSSIMRPFHVSALHRTLNPSLTDPSHSSSSTTHVSHDNKEEQLFLYSSQHSTPLPDKFDRLHAHSMQVYPTTAGKTVSALQGHFQQILMRLTKPKAVLELGTFMGYSAMAMADGMPKGAVLYTCEKDPKAAQLSRELFEEHAYSPSTKGQNVERKDATIEIVEGDGLSSLALLAQRKLRFDAVFLDADKSNYVNYYNFILDNDMLNDDGYILADNVLFSGLVLNTEERRRRQAAAAAAGSSSSSKGKGKGKKEKDAKDGEWTSEAFQKFADHIDTFNKHVCSDPRVDVVLLPAFDGLSLIMKKRQ